MMVVPSVNDLSLKVVSFNTHVYHQGYPVVKELVNHIEPYPFLLQEHWLTPSNSYYFDTNFADSFFQWVVLPCPSVLVRRYFAVALLEVLSS